MKPTIVFLPISNEKYAYILIIETGEIIERDNENEREMMRFDNYEEFKSYYLDLNKRVCLPESIEGFFSTYQLVENYFNDQHKICNIEAYVEDYLAVLDEGLSLRIDKNRLGDRTYILEILEELRPEISYDGIQKYEIPVLVLYGEYLRRLFPHLKWNVKEDYNILGKVYNFPLLNDEDIRSDVRRVLYNDGDDKMFNFQYLLDIAEVIQEEK